MTMIRFGCDRHASLAGTTVPIHLYNGGHGWTPGPVELRPIHGRGNARYGPGLYTTTKLETARTYAKGGGVISRFTVAPMRFDSDVVVTEAEALAFMRSIPGLTQRERVESFLTHPAFPRRGPLTMQTVLNYVLFPERNSMGKLGLAVIRAAVEKGVDASVVQHVASGEDWIVIYNVDKILKREVVKAGAPGVAWDLPTIFDLRRRGDAYPPVEPIPGIDDVE